MMYLTHFKLDEKPFLLNTDPRFLWLGPAHQEALATLCYGVRENKGLLLLTGDIGTGKTTLISALMDRLKDDPVSAAKVPDPGRNRNEFYFLVAHSFGIQTRVKDKESFTRAMGRCLEDIRKLGKKALLIIDEAQILNDEILEEVRLLSNLEHRNNKLLNIFLLGQDELNQSLLEPQNRAIRERIAITYHLQPLSEAETKAYITHRLRVAGARTSIFNTDAVRKIYAYSKGSVRLINILCDLALVFGFEAGAARINAETIESCKPYLCIAPTRVPPLSTPPLPDSAKDIDFLNIASAQTGTASSERKARPKPVRHTSRIGRAILFALMIFLSASYLLFSGLKHGALPDKTTVNHKIILPAPPPKEPGDLVDPLQKPPSDLVEASSLGKGFPKNSGKRKPTAVEAPDQSVRSQDRALPQDTGPADGTTGRVTDVELGRTKAMPEQKNGTSSTVRPETVHRQTNENTVDDPPTDENRPTLSEGSTRQTVTSHRPPSEAPDPAAIIDWLLREKHKNSGE